MIEAIKILEVAAAQAASGSGDGPLRIGERVLMLHQDDALPVVETFHGTYGDVLPAPNSLILTGGIDREFGFTQKSLSLAESREQLFLKYVLALGINRRPNGVVDSYTWQLHVNDYRPERNWEVTGSSLHALTIGTREKPKMSAWKIGMQGQWTELEPRTTPHECVKLVSVLAGQPSILEEANKQRAERADDQPKLDTLAAEEIALRGTAHRLTDKQITNLNGLRFKIRNTGFARPTWKYPL
jgi:hypothetical protein